MNPARRDRGTRDSMGMSGRGAGPTELRSRPDRHSQDQANALAHGPTVIVVGSTTTALLVEALAQAGMLHGAEFPADLPGQQATVSRVSNWVEAAAQAAMHTPCIAVATGPASGVVLRDSSGEPVRIAQAEELFERSRQVPPSRTGFRRVLGADASPGPLILTWFRKVFCHLQPALMSKPTGMEGRVSR